MRLNSKPLRIWINCLRNKVELKQRNGFKARIELIFEGLGLWFLTFDLLQPFTGKKAVDPERAVQLSIH